MILNHNLGQKLGHSNRLALLGLVMALGTTLPAAAQPHRSPVVPALSPDDPQGSLRMAMGHGAAGHDGASHDDPSHDDPSHEGTEHGAEGGAEAPMPIRSTEATVPLIPASHGDHFGMGFPQGWVVSHGQTDPYLTAQTPVGEPVVTTEVSWQAEAPNQVVPALLNDIREKGYTVVRYDAITMDGTTALRLWLADLPESDRPFAFISVVGYSDATAILTSRYGTRTSDLDTLLSQIHQSFRRGTPSPAETRHH